MCKNIFDPEDNINFLFYLCARTYLIQKTTLSFFFFLFTCENIFDPEDNINFFFFIYVQEHI